MSQPAVAPSVVPPPTGSLPARSLPTGPVPAGSRLLAGTATAHVALVGGRVAVIRRATRSDLAGVRSLHLACGEETLRERYLGAPPGLSDADLSALIDPPDGCALVACAVKDGEVLGLAQVFNGPPVAEIAVLVRDDQQQRGLGTMLARRAVDAAAALGCRDMVAYGVAGSSRLARLLGRLELRSQLRCEGPMVTWRAPISGAARVPAPPALRIVY